MLAIHSKSFALSCDKVGPSKTETCSGLPVGLPSTSATRYCLNQTHFHLPLCLIADPGSTETHLQADGAANGVLGREGHAALAVGQPVQKLCAARQNTSRDTVSARLDKNPMLGA